jgi:1,4-alpha-glucan branching enzyme
MLSVSARAGVTATPVSDGEIDDTFQYASATAKTVTVAGEFSNWSELPMTRDNSGTWSRTLHLKPGYYGYKLVVDGEWVLDPTNPSRKTVNDIEDSAVSIGGVQPPVAAPAGGNGIPTTFSFSDAKAASVLLAGEFNNWADNEDGKVAGHTEWLLKSDGAGNWTLTVPLAPGKYRFKYVVDGGARWEKDRRLPSTPDDNSLIEVASTAPVSTTGVLTAAGSVPTFSYRDGTAKNVSVAGDFNQWNATANPMQKDSSGVWTASIPLKPGKYQYKFIVDNNWKQDPRNPDTADDTFGGKNSVKTIGP